MWRVLVTGANGMLGTDVCQALEAAGFEALRTARSGAPYPVDVTDGERVSAVFAELRPDAVIHCAAYTDVDGAEREPEAAFRANADGTRTVAAACAARGIPLCAISTDFVFDGRKGEPYVESDPVGPLSVYGASKLAGEEAIREVWDRHWVVRTSWLFGLHGRCFPDTILRAAAIRPELRVVADQRGTPTFTEDLAATLVRLIQYPVFGTYHVANRADNGSTTWYEFARSTLQLAGVDTPVLPISTGEWPTAARRPANSALCCRRLETEGFPPLRRWQDALQKYVDLRKALAKP